jgi:hypothetical protein
MTNPLIFILSWERPLYLWACLDSLYRNTRLPCRFVLIDNASRDPLVRKVIQAFDARGLFHHIRWREQNTPDALAEAIRHHHQEIGEYFGFIESDVVALPTEPGWLEGFISLTRSNPKLAIVGSLVDRSDFVDPTVAAKRFPQLDQVQLDFLIKSKSPERRLQDEYQELLIDSTPPPGRLLFLKKEFIDQVGILRDKLLYQAARNLGYAAGIATRVRHRHLSFQNIYDYPEADLATREEFFKALEGKKPA